MLLRLIIIIILIIVIYRAVRSWFAQGKGTQQSMSGRQDQQVDDDMVRDPQCGIFFPRRQGIPLKDQGKDLLFCSEDCKKAYLIAHQKMD